MMDEIFKKRGQPPYSTALLRFVLHIRYTSAQAYELLLEKFPLPSFSLLNKIQRDGVDAIKGLKKLSDMGNISKDLILRVDKMFLQKCAQYQSGEYIGVNEDGKL